MQFLGALSSVQRDLRPSTVVDCVYYNSQTLTSQRADVRAYFGRYQQSFSSLSLNGPKGLEFVLPTGNRLLGSVAIAMKLPDHAPASGVDYRGYAIPRAWGYALIERVRVQIGSSSPIELYGAGNILQVARQCDTAHKRQAVYRNGGQECLDVAEMNGANLEAYCHLDLPFSKLSALSQKLPFDASLVAAPVRIYVDFKPLREVLAGDGNYGGAGPGVLPTNLEWGYFSLSKEWEFVHPANSIRDMLLKTPDAVYNYPYLHADSRPAIDLPGPAAAGTQFRITLNGFMDAQCLAIVLAVELASARIGRLAAGQCKPGAFTLAPMRDVILQYGGQDVYRAPNGIRALYELEHDTMPGGIEDSQITYVNPANPAAGFTSTPIQSAFTVVQLSQWNEALFSAAQGLYQYAPSIGANQLTLQFRLPVALDADGARLWAVYMYNGMILCSSADCKVELTP